MSNIQIPALPPIISLNGTEQMEAVQGGTSGRITTSQIAQFALAGGGIIVPISGGGTGANNAPDARTNLGLGTMAVQNANSVAITGGTIQGVAITLDSLDNTPIGANTPSTGVFTTVGLTGAISGSANKGDLYFGTLPYSDTNIFSSFNANVNSYAQKIISNANGGASASSDVIVSNDLGTATTHFGDFGINSSGFAGSGAFNAANSIFLTATSGDLALGTTTSNAIHFVVNGGTTDAMTISSAGVVSLGTALAVSSGGVGVGTLASNGVLYGNGTGAIQATAVGTTGQVLIGNTGSAPTWGAISSSAVSSLSFGSTGLTPNSATTGAITVAGTLNIANGGTGLTSFGTGVATALGQNVTGSGGIVLAASPTLVTPTIGAAAGTSLSLSGLTASSAVATDGSKNLVSVTNTGTGNNVLATSPTLTTPTLGVATATTINKVTLTAPATGSTLTIADGKTLTVNNTMTLAAGADSQTWTFPSTSDTVVTLGATQTLTAKTLTTPVLNGIPTGTGVATAATASTLALRDSNANLTANSFLPGYATTATAAGTTTLTVGSAQTQFFTGALAQTVVLPVTSTLVLGQCYEVVNNSVGAVLVQSSGGNTILSVGSGNTGIFTCVLTSGTTAASWSSTYISSGAGTGTVTSVALSGGTTGLTVSGSPITTAGTITLAGTLAVANGGTGITSFGTGVATALGNNVTGSGGIVLATSPTLTTPTLGVASATTINKVTITAPATGSTLTIADGKTLTVNNSLTFAGTDGNTMTFPSGSDTVVTLGATQTLTSKTLTTPVLNGIPTGTGVATAATVSTLALRDASGNLTAVNHISGFTTTATAAGTTALTVTSNQIQVFTGSTTQTVTLPTTSIVAGQSYIIINQSTGLVTVQSSGANTVTILAANTSAIFTSVVATPTTAANWNSQYIGVVITSGKSLSVPNTLTLAGTDSTTMTFPSSSSTVLTTGNTATITKGFTVTPNAIGLVSSGTTTLDGTLGQTQVLQNGGAFTLAPPSTDTEIDLLVQNVASAGAITTSSAWRVGASTGSTFSTAVRASATVTTPVASPGVVNWTAHGCVAGDPFYISGGVLPTGLTANTTYYVISAGLTANAFELATAPGGSAINFTGSSSGTQTGSAGSQFLFSARRINGVSTYSWYALQ